MKTKDEIISITEATVAAYSHSPVWYKTSIEKYMDEWIKENRLYGCYSGGKLLKIYATRNDAEKESTKWSTQYKVEVKAIEVGDRG